MVGPRKNFQNKGYQKVGNIVLRLVFVNTVFYKRAILLIFYPEFIESVLGILSYPESTKGPMMVGFEEKIFKTKDFEMAGKRYFDIGFCKYSKYFLYVVLTVVQSLCKPSTLQKLPTFDYVMTQFCLNFLKFSNFAVLHLAQPWSLHL